VALKASEFFTYTRKLGEFATRLNETGIKLAHHPHLKMLLETTQEIDALCESTPEEVGLFLDTGHAHAAGTGLSESVRRN
jgi:inosose dehydratase